MPYTTYPHQPRIRREAVNRVLNGSSLRETARHYGVEPSTISRWVKKAPGSRHAFIPTLSSRPHHHPNELEEKIVQRILALRNERSQCAEILHHRLEAEGIDVSLSSVKRTLARYGLTRFSKWKKWHRYTERPLPEKPGMLVQIDSMQEGLPLEHLYAYALIDVCSRWAWATPIARPQSVQSARFVTEAQRKAPFLFSTIQSDHGGEFSKQFTKMIEYRGFSHRHSRVRTPTDNAYVERFIQTLQRECLDRAPRSLRAWRKEIPLFLRYYNYERPHMGLGMQTPVEVLRSY